MVTRKEYNRNFGKQDKPGDRTSIEKTFDQNELSCDLCINHSDHTWSQHDHLVLSKKLARLQEQIAIAQELHEEAENRVKQLDADPDDKAPGEFEKWLSGGLLGRRSEREIQELIRNSDNDKFFEVWEPTPEQSESLHQARIAKQQLESLRRELQLCTFKLAVSNVGNTDILYKSDKLLVTDVTVEVLEGGTKKEEHLLKDYSLVRSKSLSSSGSFVGWPLVLTGLICLFTGANMFVSVNLPIDPNILSLIGIVLAVWGLSYIFAKRDEHSIILKKVSGEVSYIRFDILDTKVRQDVATNIQEVTAILSGEAPHSP